MMTVKALQDGEFGVLLNDPIQPVKFEGKEDIEVFSTWVKSKWTRIAMPIDHESRRKLIKYKPAQFLNTFSNDLVVRNDIDDVVLHNLHAKNFISWDILQYCLRHQVDEIVFRG
tara:strand:+ start:293 stop:634 length:342 start_codon:yes stop_codon:yes gene_type:complete